MSPNPSPLPAADTAGFQMAFHDIQPPRGQRFTIAIDARCDDPITLAYTRGEYPLDTVVELMFALVRPGDAVLDLGAHVGTFSLGAAAVGCDVVGVEASPHNAALLRASVARNPHLRFRVVHAALSDQEGVLRFSPHGPYGHVYSPAANLPSVEVRAVTVDGLWTELGSPRFRFVKMDIEGSEIRCLRGMGGLLAGADAPPILYENNGYTLGLFDQTSNQLKAAVERFGYRNYMIRPGQLVPVRADDVQPAVVTDYLAVKGEVVPPTGWTVTAPQTLDELVRDVRSAYEFPHAPHRRHLARVLATGPAALRAHPHVREVLEKLRHDDDPEARAAAA